jgi:hypothetical protein
MHSCELNRSRFPTPMRRTRHTSVQISRLPVLVPGKRDGWATTRCMSHWLLQPVWRPGAVTKIPFRGTVMRSATIMFIYCERRPILGSNGAPHDAVLGPQIQSAQPEHPRPTRRWVRWRQAVSRDGAMAAHLPGRCPFGPAVFIQPASFSKFSGNSPIFNPSGPGWCFDANTMQNVPVAAT